MMSQSFHVRFRRSPAQLRWLSVRLTPRPPIQQTLSNERLTTILGGSKVCGWQGESRLPIGVPIRKCPVSKFCGEALIFSIATIYAAYMPRSDNHGKQLHALLGYLLDGEVDTREI